MEDGWRGFVGLCEGAEELTLDELFWIFLTHEERDIIAMRYLIIKELIRGEKSQRQIAEELKVSIAKITRGSNFLKMLSKDLRSRLKKEFS